MHTEALFFISPFCCPEFLYSGWAPDHDFQPQVGHHILGILENMKWVWILGIGWSIIAVSILSYPVPTFFMRGSFISLNSYDLESGVWYLQLYLINFSQLSVMVIEDGEDLGFLKWRELGTPLEGSRVQT